MSEGELSLQYLLDLDGEEIHYEGGYVVRFRIRQTEKSEERPHGISYSLTLHGPDGERLLGYDNAHAVTHRGSRFKANPTAHDHWHRDETDDGRPYEFTSAEQLVADFFDEIERVLKERNP